MMTHKPPLVKTLENIFGAGILVYSISQKYVVDNIMYCHYPHIVRLNTPLWLVGSVNNRGKCKRSTLCMCYLDCVSVSVMIVIYSWSVHCSGMFTFCYEKLNEIVIRKKCWTKDDFLDTELDKYIWLKEIEHSFLPAKMM